MEPIAVRKPKSATPEADVVIVGAGLIGLSLALELHGRGARVTVVERGRAMQQASVAAAGMLAAEDPHNPNALRELARLSVKLYPGFLQHVEALGGLRVPFQTETAVQHLAHGETLRLREHSLDPRQLASAVLAAVRATPIRLLEESAITAMEDTARSLRVRTAEGDEMQAQSLVYTAGAWTADAAVTAGVIPAGSIAPRKGQMLRVQMPPAIALREVHRSEHIYIVPRTVGPQSGSALIGATVEDAGYDVTVHTQDLQRLRALAAELLPELGSASDAPQVEAWAGLRPATADELPILGRAGPRVFVATGHYRNGVLLAPATARVMADLLQGQSPELDLAAFSPDRFATAGR